MASQTTSDDDQTAERNLSFEFQGGNYLKVVGLPGAQSRAAKSQEKIQFEKEQGEARGTAFLRRSRGKVHQQKGVTIFKSTISSRKRKGGSTENC